MEITYKDGVITLENREVPVEDLAPFIAQLQSAHRQIFPVKAVTFVQEVAQRLGNYFIETGGAIPMLTFTVPNQPDSGHFGNAGLAYLTEVFIDMLQSMSMPTEEGGGPVEYTEEEG